MSVYQPIPSIAGPEVAKLSVRGGSLLSKGRRVIPPPIFLLLHNQTSKTNATQLTEVEMPEPLAVVQVPTPAVLPLADISTKRVLGGSAGLLTRGLNWIRTRQSRRSTSRMLQVTATVSLGDKRFVAVVQVEGSQFLIGGGGSNVSLLAKLNAKESFQDLLTDSISAQRRERSNPAEQGTEKNA